MNTHHSTTTANSYPPVLDDGTAELTMWGACDCPEINHPEYGEGLPVVNGHCIQCDEPIHDADKCPCTRCEAIRVDHYGPAGPPVQKVQLSSEQYELEAAKIQAIREQTEMVEYQNELIAEYQGNMPAEVIDLFTKTTRKALALPTGTPPWRVDSARFRGAAEILPSAMVRDDGKTLLYANCFNMAAGLPASGKSWFAAIAIAQTLQADGRAVYIDFEDKPETFGARMMVLGGEALMRMVEDSDRFAYVNGFDLQENGNQPEAVEWVLEAVNADRRNLVVFDSLGSGGCPMNGDDVRSWFAANIDPFRKIVATVLALDHIPKRAENRPDGPIGSQHKRATIDGASLRIYGTPWTRTQGGSIGIANDKDRHGQLPAPLRQPLGAIRGDWHGGGFNYTIPPPPPDP